MNRTKKQPDQPTITRHDPPAYVTLEHPKRTSLRVEYYDGILFIDPSDLRDYADWGGLCVGERTIELTREEWREFTEHIATLLVDNA